MKNDIRLKLNLSFLYIRQLTRHLRTSGPTGLTVLEIFASVLANPFFGPDGHGLIISTAVKYARPFTFHSILGNKISDVYGEICSCLYKIVSVTISFPQNNELLSITILCTLAKLCWQMALKILKFRSALKCFYKTYAVHSRAGII